MMQFAYRHDCGGVAFFFQAEDEPEPGGPGPLARFSVYPDGKVPRPGEAMRCGACGKTLSGPLVRARVEYA